MKALYSVVVAFALLLSGVSAHAEGSPIAWRTWSDDLFAQVPPGKLVILDLEAVWCHWCHVMDRETYANPAVAAIINKHFVAVRVDQDSRPDLSNRYQDYGWPATIIFNAKGEELAKRSGFMPPEEFKPLLEKLVKNPVVIDEGEPFERLPIATGGSLVAETREKLRANHRAVLDLKDGGLKASHKFLEVDTVEYALVQGYARSAEDDAWAQRTLAAALKLMDPVWGGVYQYSTHGDWDHPHFEKIMSSQAGALRLYALAHALHGDVRFLHAAEEVARYVRTFLRGGEGAFYTSQDADLVKGKHSADYFSLNDEKRRALGIPAIDKHIYSRENGWFIRALAALYATSGDRAYFEDGVRAANWVVANRSLEGGGFAHGERDSGGPFLGETLSMAHAFLALYGVSADRAWLARAESAAGFIARRFQEEKKAGLITAPVRAPLAAVRDVGENIDAVRFFNLLWHYTGKKEYRTVAADSLAYLADPSIALRRRSQSGVLLADDEFNHPPLHVTVIGPKSDEHARALFAAAIAYFGPYKRTEWWDRSEGPLPHAEVEFPPIQKPAAFVCSEKRCSLPIYDAAKLPNLIEHIARGKG